MLTPNLSIEFQMSLFLFVALAGYLIALRFKQSPVIGLIILGLVIGPSLLGWITYTDFVKGIAQLGAIVLLFVIGLEFRIRDVLNLRCAIIALLGVIIPWILGYYTAKLFGFDFAGAIFIGTALTATSIAITANVLKEMGQLNANYAKAIIGAAIIDDILGLLLLSMTEGIVSGGLSTGAIVFVVFKAIVFIVGGVLIGFLLISEGLVKIDKSSIAKHYPEFAFLFALMIAFVYSMISELIGLSAIVGAFIAGVVLEDVDLKHSKSFREGAEYLQIVFAAIFFVSLGILTDLKALTPNAVLFFIVLTIVAVAAKVIGCGLAARMQGFDWKKSLIIGFGMSPRGEVAMIVALIGLNQGLITQTVYVAIVLMSLLTTIITPIVLKKLVLKKEAE